MYNIGIDNCWPMLVLVLRWEHLVKQAMLGKGVSFTSSYGVTFLYIAVLAKYGELHYMYVCVCRDGAPYLC